MDGLRDGLKIACLYSYDCQAVKLLNANQKLFDFIHSQNSNKALVQPFLRKLIPYPVYCLIAKLEKKNYFDEEVVRTYWFEHHNEHILQKIKDIGYLSVMAANLVLNCAVSFGRVSGKIVVCKTLIYKKEKIILAEQERKVKMNFVNAKNGNLVSVHLGIAREKISKNQAKIIENTTLEALKVIQKA